MNRPVSLDTKSECVISPCGLYRSYLKRTWGRGGRYVNFCMVNPSKADLDINDPTVWGNEVRARKWGFDGYIITNLFDWRDTDPEQMKKAAEPCSEENDTYILRAARESDLIVCAWGNDGIHRGRDRQVLDGPLKGFALHVMKLNKNGTPAHPLYLGYLRTPVLWERNA